MEAVSTPIGKVKIGTEFWNEERLIIEVRISAEYPMAKGYLIFPDNRTHEFHDTEGVTIQVYDSDHVHTGLKTSKNLFDRLNQLLTFSGLNHQADITVLGEIDGDELQGEFGEEACPGFMLQLVCIHF